MEQPFRRERRLRVFVAAVALALLTWPAGTAQAGPFEEGLDFFQVGHYRWALEKFIEAVDRAPRDAQRWWYVAESYRLLGDPSAAAHTYRQILQMAPQSALATAARQALEALGEPALATVQVPLQKRGTSVLLPGRVNGQPVGYFILDTGATFTSLSGLVANRLGISTSGSSVRLATASGVIQAPLAVLDELDIGGAVARHVPAVIHDLPNMPPSVAGLLGLSFLERFRVNFDLSSGVLLFQSGE